jgi:hypothetical protein
MKAARTGGPSQLPYHGSKFALEGVSETLLYEMVLIDVSPLLHVRFGSFADIGLGGE